MDNRVRELLAHPDRRAVRVVHLGGSRPGVVWVLDPDALVETWLAVGLDGRIILGPTGLGAYIRRTARRYALYLWGAQESHTSYPTLDQMMSEGVRVIHHPATGRPNVTDPRP
jgi:hypothetical protein